MYHFPFDAAIEHLRARLAGPLPGTAAQLRMAPDYRKDPVLARVEDKACRKAAVLALLFPLHGEPAIVFTARHADLAQHAGQISFPGGRHEPGERFVETALRETHEEIGLPAESVEVLGALTPLYIPPSNYCVYPFVGMVPFVPEFDPHDAEVEAILHVQLSHLLDPQNLLEESWMLQGQQMVVPFFSADGHQIWGATAMMLSELLTLFMEDLTGAPPHA